MDGWVAIHIAGWPLLSVSTDFRTLDTLVDRLRNVPTKSHPEPTQSVAGRLRGWTSRPALGPFDLWFGPMWSTCYKYSYGDTIFGGTPNVLVIS
jgi:hypothetical protein